MIKSALKIMKDLEFYLKINKKIINIINNLLKWKKTKEDF